MLWYMHWKRAVTYLRRGYDLYLCIDSYWFCHSRYRPLLEKNRSETETEEGDWAARGSICHQNCEPLPELHLLLQTKPRVWRVHTGTGQQTRQGEHDGMEHVICFKVSTGYHIPLVLMLSFSLHLCSHWWRGRGINWCVCRLGRRRTEAGHTGLKTTSSTW